MTYQDNQSFDASKIKKKCLICEAILALEDDLEHCPKDGSLLMLDLDCQSFDWLSLKQPMRKGCV